MVPEGFLYRLSWGGARPRQQGPPSGSAWPSGPSLGRPLPPCSLAPPVEWFPGWPARALAVPPVPATVRKGTLCWKSGIQGGLDANEVRGENKLCSPQRNWRPISLFNSQREQICCDSCVRLEIVSRGIQISPRHSRGQCRAPKRKTRLPLSENTHGLLEARPLPLLPGATGHPAGGVARRKWYGARQGEGRFGHPLPQNPSSQPLPTTCPS